MSVLSQPNHPARLLAIFGASLAVAVVIGAAAAMQVYVINDIRDGGTDNSAVQSPQPIDAPEGLVVVIPVDDAAQFEEFTGFAPFVPSRLPSATIDEPVMSVTPPDEYGRSTGRVSYSTTNEPVEGITGPLIVIVEAEGTPGNGVDGQLKRLTTGNGRTLVATLPCGDLVLDVQMYFGPDIVRGEPFVTPYMKSTAEDFLAGVREDCGR